MRAEAKAMKACGSGAIVNAVCPGAVRTPMIQPALDNPDILAMFESTPIGPYD